MRNGHFDLFIKSADGTGNEELLLHSDQDKYASDFGWSRDGRYLVYTSTDPHNKDDLWILPMQGDRKPFLFLGTTFNEDGANFSPDGRWISYLSDESGRLEVYVRPFQPPGAERAGENSGEGQWRISKNGASGAWWREDGKELIIDDAGSLMSVDVSTNPSFRADIPQELFRWNGRDVITSALDFRKFLIAVPTGADANPPVMNVVLNWPQLLKK
jgi:eukaryotic-like serine/threonine-protein kinase